MNITHQYHRRGRAAALLLALLLGLGPAVTQASAQGGGPAVRGHRQPVAAAAGASARSLAARSGTASTARFRHRASVHHATARWGARSKTKKKSGFFKKLGIFLLVVVIVVILLVILAVWLLVRLARRAFGRRRNY